MLAPWMIDKMERERAEREAEDHRPWVRPELYPPGPPPDRSEPEPPPDTRPPRGSYTF